MNTPNTIAAVIAGDNELLKINHYLDSKFGQDSIQALTVMSDLAELKNMLAEEVVHLSSRRQMVQPVMHTGPERWTSSDDMIQVRELRSLRGRSTEHSRIST